MAQWYTVNLSDIYLYEHLNTMTNSLCHAVLAQMAQFQPFEQTKKNRTQQYRVLQTRIFILTKIWQNLFFC